MDINILSRLGKDLYMLAVATWVMRKVILVIRDGWGHRDEPADNAILAAHPPNTERLMREYPHTLIRASAEAVGLPSGYQGNSEVGHMTIGSGRIIYQSLERINQSIRDKSFFSIREFNEAIDSCIRHKSQLHLIGLLQVEGVHSHITHLFALLDLCKLRGFSDVCIHAITDGRDSPVTDSVKHLASLKEKLSNIGFGRIATISGRYYSMDRDKRWERTKMAYECIVRGIADDPFDDVIDKVKDSHNNGETDEFIVPMKAEWYQGIKDNDSIIFFNYRTDRPRQLTQAIVERGFEGWERTPLRVFFVAMTQYYVPMNARVAFKDEKIANILGETVAGHNLKQLRISETEKYAHVTFFFNCQTEVAFRGEDRIMISSPRVATYDLKPEMSVYEVANKLVENINAGKYDMIVTNLVNGDMVGHTGISEAIHKAVLAVDEALGRIVEAGLKSGYTLLVFGDHGNAEDQTPEWRTSHTLNPVDFIVVSGEEGLKKCRLRAGKGLQDVAPTVLKLMGLPQPREMTGESIIEL
jgi:2,3-bisphosphoglycerate-independent phosphoglycerate mutase